MNISACGGLPTVIEGGTWYRAARLHHLPTVLRTAHTKSIPSRFNAGKLSTPAFETLYLADSPLVALFEVQALLGSPTDPGGAIPNPAGAWVIVNAVVRLKTVIDLTDDATVQFSLSTTAQELTGDWRGYQLRNHLTPVRSPNGVAPTQVLGAAFYGMSPEIEGFVSLSSRVPYSRILCVFPDRLVPGSSVTFEYLDAAGIRQTYSLP
jgi:hypothetical protein